MQKDQDHCKTPPFAQFALMLHNCNLFIPKSCIQILPTQTKVFYSSSAADSVLMPVIPTGIRDNLIRLNPASLNHATASLFEALF